MNIKSNLIFTLEARKKVTTAKDAVEVEITAKENDKSEKKTLIGSHTARRTFISRAIAKGVPPEVVMKWTGHSDYKAMKPYIAIADSTKAQEMTKFDDD